MPGGRGPCGERRREQRPLIEQPAMPHLPSRFLVVVALLVGSADAQGAQPFAASRLERQISADPFAGAGGSEADTQVEPHVAADPSDAAVVVAVFQQGRFDDGGSVGPGFATSDDGGQTWITGSLPGLTTAVGGPFERGSDPVAAIGPDGSVYAQTLLFNTSDCRNAVAVQRSGDHGRTWGAPVLVQDDAPCTLINDKNWLAVDGFPQSPHSGRLYSVWDQIDLTVPTVPQLLRYSDDHGATWSALVTVSPPGPLGSIGALPLVQPDGDVTVLYNLYAPPPSRLVSQTSHDGGNQFDPPVTIATYQGLAVPGMRTGNDAVSALPAGAVDPLTGRLYAAWPDARFRGDGQNDIVVAVSADGGVSWGAPTVVSDPSLHHPFNHFTPAVAAHGGTVLVAYGARRGGDDRTSMRYAVSLDDGTTFGRERGIGRAGDLDFAATASGGLLFLGDYIGLTLSANEAHVVWTRPSRPRGNPSAVHHQVAWSATIRR